MAARKIPGALKAIVHPHGSGTIAKEGQGQ